MRGLRFPGLFLFGILVAIFVGRYVSGLPGARPASPPTPSATAHDRSLPSASLDRSASSNAVDRVCLDLLTDEEKGVVREAIERIESNARPPYPGKWGVRHQNRERLLPVSPGLTYKEYYLPKATGDTSRFGPRRLVVGSDNRCYFTRDHYETFIRVK